VFYAREREMLGPDGINRVLDEAKPLPLDGSPSAAPLDPAAQVIGG
jgi:hypothetical protein